MATVTSKTAAVIQAIDDATIESANIGSDGHLNLVRKDESVIDAGSISHPSGSLIMFAGAVVPSGWLLCSGQAISRTTYSELFTAIGTAYGAGDGVNTFNIPNLQYKFPRQDSGSRGASAGDAYHSHAHYDHTHAISATHSHAPGNHTHSIPTHDHPLLGGSPQGVAHIVMGGTLIMMERIDCNGWSPTHQSTITLDTGSGSQTIAAKLAGHSDVNAAASSGIPGSVNTGSAAPGSTDAGGSDTQSQYSLPPYVNVNFIIKT